MPASFSGDNTHKKKPSYDADFFAENNFSMGWLLPLLLIVLAAGLAMYFINGSSNNMDTGFEDDDTVYNIPPIIPAAPSLRKPLTIRLSDSAQISAYKNGIENQLLLYILSKEPEDSISKNRWFYFDNLHFKTGSAVITDSGMSQIANIAAILKIYATVKIKIGTYTDSAENEKANAQLAQARADAVLAALKKAGLSSLQLNGAKGYALQFAKAPDEANTNEGRIALNVTAK